MDNNRCINSRHMKVTETKGNLELQCVWQMFKEALEEGADYVANTPGGSEQLSWMPETFVLSFICPSADNVQLFPLFKVLIRNTLPIADHHSESVGTCYRNQMKSYFNKVLLEKLDLKMFCWNSTVDCYLQISWSYHLTSQKLLSNLV